MNGHDPNTTGLDYYLVGGAVRDRLLGLEPRERDFVVLGASPAEMLKRGFLQVGKDFPIFLHPVSREEYALARTLRQQQGAVHYGRDVTLKEDLSRRDLTINALAETGDGEVIDYFGGRADLQNRVLRHVSHAFAEDPLRVLRVARFQARYACLGFTIADETLALMREIGNAGALESIAPDRIWLEFDKALGGPAPEVFIEVLRTCGALGRLLPELDRLWGVPQTAKWHPEVDTGIHMLMVLHQARQLSDDPAVLFAALTHDLGKGLTAADTLPAHHGHEKRSAELVLGLCRRWPVPNRYRDLAVFVAREHGKIHNIEELRPGKVLSILEAADYFRRPERLQSALLACEADYRGRQGLEDRPYPQAQYLRTLAVSAAQADLGTALESAASGSDVRELVRRVRLQALSKAMGR